MDTLDQFFSDFFYCNPQQEAHFELRSIKRKCNPVNQTQTLLTIFLYLASTKIMYISYDPLILELYRSSCKRIPTQVK